MEDTRDRGTARAATGTGDGLLTASESAEILGVSVRTVRRWVTEGRLAGVRIRGARGPELRLERGQVEGFRLLEGGRRPATETDRAATGTDAAVKADTRDEEDGRLVRVQRAQLRAALRISNRDRRRLEQENEWLKARIQGLEETLPDRLALALAPRSRPWWRFW